MKYFAVVVLALVACQGCLAKPKPKVETNHVEELVQNAKNLAKNIGEQFGVKNFDANEVSDTITENTKKLTDTLQGFLTKLEEERKAHEGDINTGIQTVHDKLTATVADLKKAAGPDATKKADEIKVEFDKAYQTTVNQLDQFYKSHQTEFKDINSFSENLWKSILEIGTNVEKKVKSTIEEHEKTHKH